MGDKLSRREFLGTAAGSLAATQLVGRRVDVGDLLHDRGFNAMTEVTPQTGSADIAIRAFQVDVPEAELTDLRRRINATKWPDGETVTDATQGVQLATMQALARHWATDYDWRRCEASLNALPQFITEIDGL